MEYLCVRNIRPGTAIAEICQYEGLAEYHGTDDDGNEIQMPKTYVGKKVFGVEDGYLVGGELGPNDGMDFECDERSIDELVKWLTQEGFDVNADILKCLKLALL